MHIDTRSNGGYIVGPGSTINNEEYKIINDTNITPMPNYLKNWMMEHLFGTNAGKNGGKNGETKPGVQIQRSESLYTYSFTDDLLRRILHGLPEEYWTTYQGSDGEPSFLIWTTACKILGCSDLWDEYNRQHNYNKHNYKKNVGVWNGCNINIDCVTNLLVHSKFQNADKLIDYHKYQPVIPNRIIPDRMPRMPRMPRIENRENH